MHAVIINNEARTSFAGDKYRRGQRCERSTPPVNLRARGYTRGLCSTLRRPFINQHGCSAGLEIAYTRCNRANPWMPGILEAVAISELLPPLTLLYILIVYFHQLGDRKWDVSVANIISLLQSEQILFLRICSSGFLREKSRVIAPKSNRYL